MKIILLLFLILLCGSIRYALGQQNIQFIYIGSASIRDADLLITSAAFQGDYLKEKDSRLAKIYYTDHRTLDTIKSYISHSNWVKRSDTTKRENGKIDTTELLDAYKITGADAYPLYVKGKDCFELFTSTMRHLVNVGLFNTAGYNAMERLMFQCNEGPYHRGIDLRRFHQTVDTFRIKDTPRILVKPE